jgi:hypothetical protein
VDTPNVNRRQRAGAGLERLARQARRLVVAAGALGLMLLPLRSSAAGEPSAADQAIGGSPEASSGGDSLNVEQPQTAPEPPAPGSIHDVHDQMEDSHRRLSLGQSGEKTQEVQDHIVAMLTSLIEEMEKCDGKCPRCGCRRSACKCGQKSGGGQGGRIPGISSGTSTAARRVVGGGSTTTWADLRNKARESRVFAALKTRFPARYRQLVEQYYQSLQEETGP